MFGGNGRVRALAARSAVRDGCPQAGVSKANRRRRLLGRRRENLSISAKNKSHPIRVVFCFYMVEGEIRIRSEHAGGMFIGQFKNRPILLSDFSVPRKEKPDAGESLHLRHKKQIPHHRWGICFFICGWRDSNRARAKREKHAGGMFRCPCACRPCFYFAIFCTLCYNISDRSFSERRFIAPEARHEKRI